MDLRLTHGSRRYGEEGNVLLIALLMVTLLTALATAHFATVQKNSRMSSFVSDLGDLRRYADSGVSLAIHELNYGTGYSDGKIGTELWSTANDVGHDGRAGTHDEGEGDGIPTPGEPSLISASVGPSSLGYGLLVTTMTTASPNVKRVVSTAYNSRTWSTVEVYTKSATNSMPGVGAVYVQQGLILDLKGNSFLISGNDTNPNGTAGPNPAVFGIATSIGTPAGENASDLKDQVPLGREDHIIGTGANPSIGESGAMDFDSVFNGFKASKSNVIVPGTYSNVAWGNDAANDYKVTYCNGDVHLSGDGKGAGALVIEGSLTMSGKFEFVGLVIVRGDVKLTGGGSGVHIFGSLMIGKTLSALDPDMDLSMTGNADVRYSSVGLSKATALLSGTYSVMYWNVIK